MEVPAIQPFQQKRHLCKVSLRCLKSWIHAGVTLTELYLRQHHIMSFLIRSLNMNQLVDFIQSNDVTNLVSITVQAAEILEELITSVDPLPGR